MSELRRRYFDLPGQEGQIHALDFGDPNRPVDIIFSHANGFNALAYRYLLEPLADRYRIIAFDMRGHGRTTLPAVAAPDRDWSDLRGDYLGLIEALKIDQPVVLAGHSLGGAITLYTAHAVPHLTRSVALFEAVIPPDDDPPSTLERPLIKATLRRRAKFASREEVLTLWRSLSVFKAWPDQMLADYVTDGFVDDPDGGVRLACSPEWEASSYLSDIRGRTSLMLNSPKRTFVLKGEKESTTRIRPGDPRLADHPLVSLVEVAGTTHFLPMERVDLVRATLDEAAKVDDRS